MRHRPRVTSILIAAITCWTAAVPAAHADLNAGLVAYWPLDGNAQDASGNGHHGTVAGATPAVDRHGNSSACYDFDGIDDFIFGSAEGLPTAERTTAFWFYADNLDRPSPFGYGGGGCGTTWFVGINHGFCECCVIGRHCSGIIESPLSSITAESWHHVAVTTHATGTRLYIDGRLVASNAVFENTTNVTGTEFSIGVIPSPGGDAPYTDGNVQFMSGRIDEVRVYDRALATQELRQLADRPLPGVSPFALAGILALLGLAGSSAVVRLRRVTPQADSV